MRLLPWLAEIKQLVSRGSAFSANHQRALKMKEKRRKPG